jgi:hypothetical protein
MNLQVSHNIGIFLISGVTSGYHRREHLQAVSCETMEDKIGRDQSVQELSHVDNQNCHSGVHSLLKLSKSFLRLKYVVF